MPKSEDKYIEKFINPIIEDLKAVWKLDETDEWLKEFKKTLGIIINKIYEGGFQDGYDEAKNEKEKTNRKQDKKNC